MFVDLHNINIFMLSLSVNSTDKKLQSKFALVES